MKRRQLPTKLQEKELEICHEILNEHNITFKDSDILGSSRLKEFVFIRALIVFILRNKGYSLAKTGQIINRDHATILHAEKYDRKQGKDKRYAKIIKAIKNRERNNSIIGKMEYHVNELIRLTVELDIEQSKSIVNKLKSLEKAIIATESNN